MRLHPVRLLVVLEKPRIEEILPKLALWFAYPLPPVESVSVVFKVLNQPIKVQNHTILVHFDKIESDDGRVIERADAADLKDSVLWDTFLPPQLELVDHFVIFNSVLD